jgi:hypothetical protein
LRKCNFSRTCAPVNRPEMTSPDPWTPANPGKIELHAMAKRAAVAARR